MATKETAAPKAAKSKAAPKAKPAAPETPETQTAAQESILTTTTTEAPANTLDLSGLIEVPAKICAQIGQRKRYFNTREEAIAALQEFTDKQNKPKGASRVCLTAEQKKARAEQREVLLTFAAKQGKEGKLAAMLANTLEDICAAIPALFPLVQEFNFAAPLINEVEGDLADASGQVAEPEAAGTVDPLAEFNV